MAFEFPNEPAEYRRERRELLDREVRLRAEIEAVAEQRRSLPLGGRLKEDYVFEQMRDGGVEQVPFADLFAGHSSLLLYTMMFGSGWDAPCPSCTSIVDSINVNGRTVRQDHGLAVVAGASAQQMADWQQKRGWDQMEVVSGEHGSYVLDYAGFETDDPGLVSVMNVFKKTADGIFHSWASELLSVPMDNGHPRHADSIWPLWNLLDLTPEGRGETMVPAQDFEHRYFSEFVLGVGIED